MDKKKPYPRNPKWYYGDPEGLGRIPVRADLSVKPQGEPTRQIGWKIHEHVGVGIFNVISTLNKEERGWYYR